MRRVKLFNLSKLPDKPLLSLLEHAVKEAGCDPDRGPIFTKCNRGGRIDHGICRSWTWVAKRYINVKRKKLREADAFVRIPNGHFVEIWPRLAGDPLACAESIYHIAVHEYAHVADKQQHKPFGQYKRQWANRPHERRAITAAMFGSLKRDAKRDDLILNLAIAIEGQQ